MLRRSAKNFKSSDREFQGLGQGLQQQFQAGLDSLQSAQQQQSNQVAAGMAELKALLVASQENKKQRCNDPEL